MRYFITGATGFIGGELAKQLREAGHEVIALARDPARATTLDALGVQVVQGDITNKESMRAPMTGVDGVFHVAGWYKVGIPNTDAGVKINIEGTRNVLEMMQELSIPRGVYTSTLAVNSGTGGKLVDESYHFDGQHLTEYDRTKAAAHHDVAVPMINEGLPLIIVMPGMVYGPGDTSDIHDVFVQYLQQRMPMVPQQAALCWAHVEDVAHGHILVMEKGQPGETYIICGEPYTLVEAFDLAEQITGIPAPRLKVPPALMRVSSVLAGIVEKFTILPVAYSSEGMRTMAGTTYLGDNSKAKRELGYNPRPLTEGLRETLQHELRELEIQPPGTAT